MVRLGARESSVQHSVDIGLLISGPNCYSYLTEATNMLLGFENIRDVATGFQVPNLMPKGFIDTEIWFGY